MTMIIQDTCGLWDIDYNSDNPQPEFMTIFVTWQWQFKSDTGRTAFAERDVGGAEEEGLGLQALQYSSSWIWYE